MPGHPSLGPVGGKMGSELAERLLGVALAVEWC